MKAQLAAWFADGRSVVIALSGATDDQFRKLLHELSIAAFNRSRVLGKVDDLTCDALVQVGSQLEHLAQPPTSKG